MCIWYMRYVYVYVYVYIYMSMCMCMYLYVYVNVYVYVYILPIIYFGMPACETSEAVLGWLRGTTCPRIFFVFLFAKQGKRSNFH
jgi:hypothetical protein